MQEQQPGKIVVHVDPDLSDLIPGYLANREMDIAAIHDALGKNDFDTIRNIGHGMKGSGGGYGFEDISDIGMLIEKSAKDGQVETILIQIKRLKDYLDQVDILYG